jgi:hypothetical protein
MSLAVQIIRTVTFTLATTSKVETATNVLDKLYCLKKSNSMPYLAIRRAIKLQENIVKDLK